jgi:hypothetical protein
MSMDRSGVRGWKRHAADLLDRIVLQLPFATEVANQGASKNLAILAAFHLLSRIELEGDYLEFGVFRGETFRNAIRAARQGFRATREGRFLGRFVAFDSFQGLPPVPSMNERINVYAAGEFAASRESFDSTVASVRRHAAIEVVPGWFADTLNADTARRLRLEKAAFVNVDCDLYESTDTVLDFVTPLLQTGTVLYFDDWFSQRGSMHHGEARAAAEWLARNPQIRLIDYRNAGITGKMFLVNVAEPTA